MVGVETKHVFERSGQSIDIPGRKLSVQLSDEQSQAIVDIVAKSPAGEIRMAAAQVLGGLSLPSGKVKDLIIQAGDVK